MVSICGTIACEWLALEGARVATMKNLLPVILVSTLLVACSGEGLSPERKACLEKATTESERIACNNAAAIRTDKGD